MVFAAEGAGAACSPEWGAERALAAKTPFNPHDVAQLPVSAVLAYIFAPYYRAYLMDRADFERKIAAAARDRRPLLEIGDFLNAWVEGRPAPQQFWNAFVGPAGDRLPELLEALSDVGAIEQARALGKAVARFGDEFPRDNRERAKRMGAWDKPSAFGRELMSFGNDFGPREALLARVAEYVCANPALTQWFLQARSQMTEMDRLGWVFRRLLTSYELYGEPELLRAKLSLLPPAYRTVVLVFIAEAEYINGGVSQFFSNSSGAFAPETITALRDVGLSVRADAIEKAIGWLPKPYPIDTEARRQALLASNEASFEALDVEFRGEPFEPALIDFARRNDVIPR